MIRKYVVIFVALAILVFAGTATTYAYEGGGYSTIPDIGGMIPASPDPGGTRSGFDVDSVIFEPTEDDEHVS